MISIQPSTQQNLLITLHVSALIDHLQVFPFVHYQLIELQRELHTLKFKLIMYEGKHLKMAH
jgi:hypothetical protein